MISRIAKKELKINAGKIRYLAIGRNLYNLLAQEPKSGNVKSIRYFGQQK